MERVRIDGAELEVEFHGDGEPVLLVHGSTISSAFAAMAGNEALRGYRLIHYVRRGHRGSSAAPPGFTIEEEAADAASVLVALGVRHTHVVGGSYGGSIALQLAVQAPALVHSLSLLEPPLASVHGAEDFWRSIAPIVARVEAGEKREALDDLFVLVGGPRWKLWIGLAIQGSYEEAFASLDTFVAAELPAIRQWRLDPEDAAGLTMPILLVRGTATSQWFVNGHELLRRWIPHAEEALIAGAPHHLPITHPGPVAEAIGAFLARHPLR